jgi:hypothetical protein
LQTFLSLREELRVRCPRAEWFDLRFRDRIYVMQPLDAVTPAAPPAPAPAGAGPDPSTRETALPPMAVTAIPLSNPAPAPGALPMR